MKTPIHILGSGPSHKTVREFTGPTIAINREMSRYPAATYFLTMDYYYANKYREEISKFTGGKFFIANLADPNLKDGKTLSDKRFGVSYDLSHFDVIVKSRSSYGFSFRWVDFRNGCFSGFSAIQLAILLGYTDIRLVGFDLFFNDATHWHTDYPEPMTRQFRARSMDYQASLTNALRKVKNVIKVSYE